MLRWLARGDATRLGDHWRDRIGVRLAGALDGDTLAAAGEALAAGVMVDVLGRVNPEACRRVYDAVRVARSPLAVAG